MAKNKTPEVAIGATITDEVTAERNVKAEQARQAQLLAEQQNRQAEINVSDQQKIAAEQAKAAQLEAEIKRQETEAAQAQLQVPLSVYDQGRLAYLEQLAMSGKSQPIENMQELGILRQRAKLRS